MSEQIQEQPADDCQQSRWFTLPRVSPTDWDQVRVSQLPPGKDIHGEANFVMRLRPATPFRLLDAGCGTGRVGIELERRGADLVVKTAVLVYIATFILGLVLSFPLLAFLNWSRLDSRSAFQVSSLITASFVIVVTGYGALRLARRVEGAALLHGFLVGLLVALISLLLDVLFIRAIELVGLGLYVLMVAAGLLGGVLARQRREQS